METVKYLLAPRQSFGRGNHYTRPADIKTLLDEYSTEASIQLDSAAIARDIYQRTLGHKGLVGTCCAALETMVTPGKFTVSIKVWELYAVADLVRYIRQQDTYASIVQALGSLKEKHREIVGLVLRHGSVIVKDVRALLVPIH